MSNIISTTGTQNAMFFPHQDNPGILVTIEETATLPLDKNT